MNGYNQRKLPVYQNSSQNLQDGGMGNPYALNAMGQMGQMGTTDESLAALQAMSPEERAAMFEDYEGMRKLMEEQALRSTGYAGTPLPEGRTVGDNIYVAANPLEHFAAGMQRYKGLKGLSESDTERKAMSDRMANALRAFQERRLNAY